MNSRQFAVQIFDKKNKQKQIFRRTTFPVGSSFTVNRLPSAFSITLRRLSPRRTTVSVGLLFLPYVSRFLLALLVSMLTVRYRERLWHRPRLTKSSDRLSPLGSPLPGYAASTVCTSECTRSRGSRLAGSAHPPTLHRCQIHSHIRRVELGLMSVREISRRCTELACRHAGVRIAISPYLASARSGSRVRERVGRYHFGADSRV